MLPGVLNLMRIKKTNNSAFTLLEILLASIIFILSIACVFVTLNAVRKPVLTKEYSLQAAVFGNQVLQALSSTVKYGTAANTYYDTSCANPCGNFNLSIGHHVVAIGSTGLSWPTGFAAVNASGVDYTVSCADGTSGATCTNNHNVAHAVALNINTPVVP
jgi:hypothetical protein